MVKGNQKQKNINLKWLELKGEWVDFSVCITTNTATTTNTSSSNDIATSTTTYAINPTIATVTYLNYLNCLNPCTLLSSPRGADTIPGPSNSIRPQKMYIFEKKTF